MSAVEGQKIGDHLWLQYDDSDKVVFGETGLEARALNIGISRETVDGETTQYSIDLYQIQPYLQE